VARQRRHLVVLQAEVNRLFVQTDVNFAVFAAALPSVLRLQVLTVVATQSWSPLQAALHVDGPVVELQVAVLYAQDVELGLRLSLLFSQRFLDVGHQLHGLPHLRVQLLILSLHFAQTLYLGSK